MDVEGHQHLHLLSWSAPSGIWGERRSSPAEDGVFDGVVLPPPTLISPRQCAFQPRAAPPHVYLSPASPCPASLLLSSHPPVLVASLPSLAGVARSSSSSP
jgi:hypothetical protein